MWGTKMSNVTAMDTSSSGGHMSSHLDRGVSSSSICTCQINTNQMEIILTYVTNDLA